MRTQMGPGERMTAVLRALAAVTSKPDRDAVGGAIRAVYFPWLDESVRRFQHALDNGEDYIVEPMVDWRPAHALPLSMGSAWTCHGESKVRLRLRASRYRFVLGSLPCHHHTPAAGPRHRSLAVSACKGWHRSPGRRRQI